MRKLVKLAVAAVAVVALAMPAAGDIKRFNEAVKAGDFKTAAVEAADTWRTFDKTRPETALIAREFGFVSYMAGDFAAAREYGLFLKEQGAKLPAPDADPVISALLLYMAELRLKPKNAAARKALDASLKARLASPSAEAISLMASEALYGDAWDTGNWKEAEAAAAMAAQLFQRAGPSFADRALRAQAFEVAADYIHGQSETQRTRMVAVHDAVVDLMNGASDPVHRAALTRLKFETQTWIAAMEAAEPTMKRADLKPVSTPLLGTNLGRDGWCRGRMEASGSFYPQSAAFRGVAGALLVRVDFDAEGRIIAHETLAAVPHRDFGDIFAGQKTKFRMMRGENDPADCRLDVSNYVFTLTFSIG